MAIIQKWQQINIRSLWLHIILGVIAVGSGLSACATSSNYTSQTASILTIHKALKARRYSQRVLIRRSQATAQAASYTIQKDLLCVICVLSYEVYHTGLWIAKVLGTRSAPAYFSFSK